MIYKIYTIILLVITTQTSARTENRWVDPHSLDGNIYYKDDCVCQTTDPPREIILSHYQRTLNLLLKSLIYNPEKNSYKGLVTIDLSTKEYDFIKGFSDRGVISNDEWNELDRILTRVYTKPKTDELMDAFMSWKEMFMFYFYCKEALIFSGVLLCLIFVYNLLNAKIKTWTVAKYLILALYLVDFGFVWIRLLQEQEVEKMVNSLKYQSMPPECDPNKMGFFQFVKHSFGNGNDKCKEYHSAMFADDLWKVNPLKVFGTQMGDLIQTPANAFGTAFGEFTSGILNHLSWYMAPLIPIILIFVLLMICIMLSFLTKTSFGFNFLYLIQFSFGKEDRKKVDDVISSNHLKTIMNFMHKQPAVREIRMISSENVPARPVLSSIEDVPSDKKSPRKSIEDKKNRSPKFKPVEIEDVYDDSFQDEKDRSPKNNAMIDDELIKSDFVILKKDVGITEDNRIIIKEAKKSSEMIQNNEAISVEASTNNKKDSDSKSKPIEASIENKVITIETTKNKIIPNPISQEDLIPNIKKDLPVDADKVVPVTDNNEASMFKEKIFAESKVASTGDPIVKKNEIDNEKFENNLKENVEGKLTERIEIKNESIDDISLTCSDDEIGVLEECDDEDCKCRSKGKNDEKHGKPSSGGGDYF